MPLRFLALMTAIMPLVACTAPSTPIGAPPPIRDGSAAAESACVAAVNTNFGRSVATVTESIGSEAGTEVTVAAEGEVFRCIASSDGVVADLRAIM